MKLTPYLEDKLAESRSMYELGTSAGELVEILHDQGLSLPEVSSVIARVLAIAPEQAHIIVADNPVWVEVVDLSSPVIAEVMQVLDRDGDVDDLGDGVIVFRESLADDGLNTQMLAQQPHPTNETFLVA